VLQESKTDEKDMLFKYVSLGEKSSKKKKSIKKRTKLLTASEKKQLNLFKLQPDDIK